MREERVFELHLTIGDWDQVCYSYESAIDWIIIVP